MQRTEIQCFADAEQVCHGVAERVVQAAREALAARGRFSLVLAGGSTPRRTYQLLGQPCYSDQVDWSLTDFFWGDERPVPPDHADSNYGMVHRELLSKIAADANRVHRLPGEQADLDLAAGQYAQRIAEVLGRAPESGPPAFDLVLLGMGADGHTASLFPGTPALDESRRWVVANSVLQLNTRRLTMTTVLLNCAREIAFLVTGASKAPALADVLEGVCDPHRLPAQLIKPTCGRVTWFVDREAASRLKQAKEPRTSRHAPPSGIE